MRRARVKWSRIRPIVSCVCTEHIVPRSRTASVILTAAVSLLITAVQTVVVSIALPQGPDAALVMALELLVSAGPRF